jgi:hypothetical protein
MLTEYFNINEFWSPIEGYESLYEVSNWGRIKSLEKVILYSNGRRYLYEEKILKLNPSNGYRTISLVKDKVKVTHMVHRLVAFAFKENPLSKPFVNHEDGDRSNNYYLNLTWSTNSENQYHSYNVLGNKAVKGESNGASKLNEKDITIIRALYATGISQSEIGKLFGICQQAITKVISRKTWAHV